jgi:hypothetical protein
MANELKYTYAEPKDRPISSISDGYADGTLEVYLQDVHTANFTVTGIATSRETIVVIEDGVDSAAIKLTHVHLLIKALEDIAARGVTK